MRPIDADELTEMVWRERLDTRERIANLIARQPTIKRAVKLCAECAFYNLKSHKCTRGCKIEPDSKKGEDIHFFVDCPLPDAQPEKRCRMIPQKPDCRGYTDTFFCTNCQLHIHLGFIGQRYGGNFCLECGAEVEDGETE